jgi:hypothetical protein
MELPCRKCGERTRYDGVGVFGAKTVCRHCRCKKPHNLRGHPLFPFLLFFIGVGAFVLINPFAWSDDALLYGLSSGFFLLFWHKGFGQPYFLYRSHLKAIQEESTDADIGPPKSWFCMFWFLLLLGLLMLFIFFKEIGSFDEVEVGDYVFPLKGHEVMDGIDSIPSTLTDGEKTEITFVNRMKFVVLVYCRDLKGNMSYKMRLLPNWAEKSEAYVGQTWLVTDKEKKPLYFFLAENAHSDGAIGRARVPPENLILDSVVD